MRPSTITGSSTRALTVIPACATSTSMSSVSRTLIGGAGGHFHRRRRAGGIGLRRRVGRRARAGRDGQEDTLHEHGSSRHWSTGSEAATCRSMISWIWFSIWSAFAAVIGDTAAASFV